MKNQVNKILIAGEGGQGIQTIAKILTLALEKTGLYISYIPQFGPEQRGTPSVAFIQYSEKPINYPRFNQADFLIILRKRAIPIVSKYNSRSTEVIFDSSTIPRTSIQQTTNKTWGIPATKLTEEHFDSKSLNLIVLSAFANQFLQYSHNALWEVVLSVLGSKFANNSQLKLKSKEAFDSVEHFNFENKKYSRPEYDVTSGIILKKNQTRRAVVIPKFCKGCSICIEKCPVRAISFGKNLGVYGTPVPDVDINKCIACGNCFKFCPDNAIKVEKLSN
jgi:2-oxoglutarate ferredoxin oxidoreductase subunit gamma